MEKRILVVEDVALEAANIQRRLEILGYNVVIASSYEGAIEALDSDAFEVAVLDIHLGNGKSGIDVAEYIGGHKSDVAIVFLTGFAAAFNVVLERLGYIAAFTQKPPVGSDDYNGLAVNIALALHNKNSGLGSVQSPSQGSRFFHIPNSDSDGRKRTQLDWDSVVYVKSDDKLLNIYSLEGGILVRHTFTGMHNRVKNLKAFADLRYPHNTLVQIHQSYLINRAYIESIFSRQIKLKYCEERIPVGDTYKSEMDKLETLYKTDTDYTKIL